MNHYDTVRLLLLRQTLRRRDHWTRHQLERHQAQALSLLRAHAYSASPFYRRFHAGLLDRPLQELPSFPKTMLMEHFDELVTDPAVRLADIEAHVLANRWNEPFLGRYRLLLTSGTTGRRGFFLFNRIEWRTVLASYARATRDWPQPHCRMAAPKACGGSEFSCSVACIGAGEHRSPQQVVADARNGCRRSGGNDGRTS